MAPLKNLKISQSFKFTTYKLKTFFVSQRLLHWKKSGANSRWNRVQLYMVTLKMFRVEHKCSRCTPFPLTPFTGHCEGEQILVNKNYKSDWLVAQQDDPCIYHWLFVLIISVSYQLTADRVQQCTKI